MCIIEGNIYKEVANLIMYNTKISFDNLTENSIVTLSKLTNYVFFDIIYVLIEFTRVKMRRIYNA